MKKKSLLFLGTAMMMLWSCSPMYETRYVVVPPQTQSGKYCANKCIQNKDTCINTCQSTASALEMTNSVISAFKGDDSYKDCKAKCATKGYIDGGYFMQDCQAKCTADHNNSRNGSPNYMQDCERSCTKSYMDCHNNCGGHIKTEEVCVAFCKDKPQT